MTIFHIPKKDKWEFDESVTNIFEDMLQRSIPQYEVMRDAVTAISVNYLSDAGSVLDLGCSKGDQISRLMRLKNDALYYGVEVSEPMAAAAKARFATQENVSIYPLDLRREFPPVRDISVTLLVLTLQFVPIEYRLKLLDRIYNSLSPGGCLILVEKLIGASARIDEEFVEQYYQLKTNNEYSQIEIARKRLSLEGVLVPMTYNWNIEMLKISGFKEVDCFWRWMNFAGILAIK